MANNDTEIYILGQAINAKLTPFEKLTQEDFSSLSHALKLYLTYCKLPITTARLDPRVSEEKDSQEQIQIFHSGVVPAGVLQEIINYLSKAEVSRESRYSKAEGEEKKEEKETDTPYDEEEKKDDEEEIKAPERGVAPAKEDSTVPVIINELVENLKKKQSEEVEAEKNIHTTAKAIEKARAIWGAKHRVDLIRANRLALIQDKSAKEQQREMDELEEDLFLIKTVNPKAESARVLTQNIERISRQAVIAQAANLGIGLTNSQINKAVEDLVYAGLSGAVDYTNFQNLNIVTQLAFRNQGIAIESPINDIDTAILAREHELEVDPYSEKPDQLEEYINKADEESQKYFVTSSKNLFARLNRENPDIKDNLEEANTEQQKIANALLVAVPNPRSLAPEKVSPLSQGKTAQEFELALRQADPSLKISESQAGAQAGSLLKQVDGNTPGVGPEIIHLAAIGLTPEKFAKAEDFAKNNSETPLGKMYLARKDVFAQVRYQIKVFSKTKLGEEIKDSVKPLTSLGGTIANAYNKNPAIQAAKAVIDPVGTAKSWAGRLAGRQIGQRLIESSGNALAKKLGGYLLEHGLQGGIKAFTNAVGKKAMAKIAAWAALKLGITLTLSAIPVAGPILNIIVQAGVWVFQKTAGAVYNGFQNLAESIYGEKIKARDLLAPLVALGGAAATAGAAAVGGLIFIARTAQVAVVSAAGIVIGSVTVMGLYLGFAYLVAPILSTLVQLDTKEKVKYDAYSTTASSSSDCAWPTKGHYSVTTGPSGGTHSLNHLEAIDIYSSNINGTQMLSATTGTVTFTGVYSNYGNTAIVRTKNSAGSFDVYYGHMSAITVGKGQQIAQGAQIGIVGGSGGWDPHIHMEYKGIKYNQCPAGGLKIKEGCCEYGCPISCSAFSN